MYRKILVTLDGSELSECVLPHVEAFRKGFPGCEVVFLRVVETGFDAVSAHADAISPDQWKAREESLKSAAEEYLEKVVERLEPGGGPVRREVVAGRIEDRIVTWADSENVDLILMATHGRTGVKRWVMGSIAGKVLRSSKVPVLMVRAPGA